MIKNIIFDVGRVLVDYTPVQYLKDRGYGSEEQKIIMQAIFDSTLWQEMDQGLHTTQEAIEGYIGNAEPAYRDVILDAYSQVQDTISEMPYAEQWVRDLKEKGYQLYILSNYSEDLYHRTRNKMPFLPYMDGIVFSHQCHLIKPDKEIFRYICSRYALKPEESVFIDDNAENVKAAGKCGMHTIQFFSYEDASRKLEKLLLRKG